MKNPLLVKYPKISIGVFVLSILFLLVAIASRGNYNFSLTSWSISAFLCFLVYPLDKEEEM
jgi:hypothetical protein